VFPLFSRSEHQSGLLAILQLWPLAYVSYVNANGIPRVMLIHSVNGTDIPSADGTNIPSIHHDLDGVNPHDRSVNGTDVQLTLAGGTMPPFLFLMALEFPHISRTAPIDISNSPAILSEIPWSTITLPSLLLHQQPLKLPCLPSMQFL